MKSDIKLSQGEERKFYVKRMFNAIARRYDLLNHLLSLGIDIYWRKKAIGKLSVSEYALVLDLACGTGDFALETIRQKKCHVVGADIAAQMLVFGNQKKQKKKEGKQLWFANADGEQLPFPDNSFDGATIAFGIRNMGDMDQALREFARVLKPSAPLVVLEFSLPQFRPFRAVYLFYFKHILPRVGALISGDREAYSYLPLSVGEFPSIPSFREKMKQAGFSPITHWRLLNGVAVIYRGLSG
ncbi:MAG TPA: bifunctional demethylmenaquinone methyltransferase/2-methoxy-6-polyprenyl-1,4-benzoquinol methylase UbiE [Calditrichaeota bacterium]|nr:bifunctional demethylmenaquinone methyltransferase/2-methoxy-6-polyprenyl-1,4-benzoquinol methylase UbiE [Calditrichota bacterium]